MFNNNIFKSEEICILNNKEKLRLQEISEYGLNNYDINDKRLQAITTLAATIFEMPLAFITLVKETYVDFLSREGCDLIGTSRENSFCNIAIEQNEFFEVCDSTIDPRFTENIFVKDQPNPLVYYGGYPIKTSNGFHLGSLCVCDFKRRELNKTQKKVIETLSDQVILHLEYRKNNKKLVEELAKSEKLSKAKDDFVSNMSHELRTPLNAINGYAEILVKSNLDFEQRDAINIIKSSCEILITLINDILDFSKIESGKLHLERIPFNIHKAMRNIRDLLKNKAIEKKNSLLFFIDDKIPISLLGDKVRINQILVNLLGNALKFTENGTVTLSVKINHETDDYIILDFSVKDTGIGIQEDKLDSIFERFEQIGKETSIRYGGTGLGLNISKNLVELHGSKLRVKSILGSGSEFYFSIKYKKVIQKKINNTKNNNINESSDKIKDIHILICEDNLVNIKLIKNLFKNRLSNIQIAENGKMAIEILRKNTNFDLILMDIHMPEMDGIETTRYIRNIMKLKIPIIGFSATCSKEERKNCYESGMNDYIKKTFIEEDFYEKLSSSLPSKTFEEDKQKNIKKSIVRRSISANNIIFRINKNSEELIKLPILNKKNESSNNLFSKFNNSIINIESKLKKEESDYTTNFQTDNNIDTKTCICVVSYSEENDNYKRNKKETNNKIIKDNNNLFNNNILKDISLDDIEFEKELVGLFLSDFPSQMDILKDAIKRMDEKAINFSVHKMKSSLLMIGFNKILEKLENIKVLFLNKSSEFLLNEFENIANDVDFALKQLKHYIEHL